MPIFRLLQKIISIFSKLDIEYMLSGSMAMNFYSVSRATRDIDIVINLKENEIDRFINYLDNFYFNKETIINETQREGMFNIIDLNSGFKIDLILLKKTEYFLKAFNRKKISKQLGSEIYIISIEDLIIAKLLWIQQLQSERQKEDIKMLLKNEETDIKYIKEQTEKLKINVFNLI